MVLTNRNCFFIFLGLGLLIYFYSLFNGFVWDDYHLILENNAVKQFNLGSIFLSSAVFPDQPTGVNFYYKPLMYLAFTIIYKAAGESTFLYHLSQFLLHLANTYLVLVLFKHFFSPKKAFLLSIIFLIHPINFEAAGYIAATQDTLFFTFGISALLLSIKKVSSVTSIRLILIGSLLLLSLLSKETGLLFIIIILIYFSLYQFKQFKTYLGLSAGVMLIYFLLRSLAAASHYGFLTKSAIMEASYFERLITVPSAISYYISTFFFPWNLSIDQQWVVKTINFNNFYLPLIIIIFFTIGWFLIWRRLKSNQLKTFYFFSLWLAMGLATHSHILIPLDMTVADRWFYFTMIGFLGLIGLSLNSLNFKTQLNYKITLTILVILIAGLSIRTFIRSLNWADRLTLYRHDVPLSKDSYTLQNKLAATLILANQSDKALPYLEHAVSLNDHYNPILSNLGVIYEKKGDYQTALNYYQKALDVNKGGANYQTLGSMARLELFGKKNPQKAKQISTEAIKQYPADSYLKLIQALAVYEEGDQEKAVKLINALYATDKSKTVYNAKITIERKLPLK